MRKKVEELLKDGGAIKIPNAELYKQNKKNWDAVAKPLDGMGKFEDFIAKIGAILGTQKPDLSKTKVLVLCSDNGIVEEGISQSEQDVTALCAKNISAYQSALGAMAKAVGVDIDVVDIGMINEEEIIGVSNRKVAFGTKNFRKEPAMTKEQAIRAMQVGMDLVKEAKEQGYSIVATGEMGIGNTTTSSAICAALLNLPAKEVTGKGAGLNDIRLQHKIKVIEESLNDYALCSCQTLEILQTFGGFDIAGMVGIFLGGAYYQLPIVMDGIISMAAALIAKRLSENVREYIIPSHKSKEPAVEKILQELQLDPVIDAKMALGEGTGALMMISLLRMANEVYKSSASFGDYGLIQYERFEDGL